MSEMVGDKLRKRFRVKLNRAEMEVLLGMVVFGMYSLADGAKLAELAYVSRLYRIGGRLQKQMMSSDKQSYTLSLNIEEADVLEDMFRISERLSKLEGASPLCQVVMYKVRDAVTPNL